MEPEELLKKILRENNFSVTKQRLVVFRLLLGQEPQSIQSLVARSKRAIDRVSIYRIVELYEKLGIINRIVIGWKYKLELSDIFQDHHHHLSCLHCGKVIALKDEQGMEDVIKKLSNAHNFRQISHQLEIQGYCPDCLRHYY